jgi:hypothetical protein
MEGLNLSVVILSQPERSEQHCVGKREEKKEVEISVSY